ncbi:hypothetical protein ACFV2N_48220 [Streptomyces sp. NPDC059680]
MQVAIREAEGLGGRPLAELLPADQETGKIRRIKLVTDTDFSLSG